MNKQQKETATTTTPTVASIFDEMLVDAEGLGDSAAILTMRTAQAALLTTKLALDSGIIVMDGTVKLSRMGCKAMPTSSELQLMLTQMTTDNVVVTKPKAKAKAKPKANK